MNGANAFFKVLQLNKHLTRLARYRAQGVEHIGVVLQDHVIDIHSAAPSLPGSIRQILEESEWAINVIVGISTGPIQHSLAEIELLAPIPDPQKILAIGMNYKAHAEEARKLGIQVPNGQMWFNKQVSAVSGPRDAILNPNGTETLDYEGELGVVIGRKCRAVSAEAAEESIAGWLVCNDVSVREWQSESTTITLGKSYDSHSPQGPWLTLGINSSEIASHTLRCWVNGELRQETLIADMIHPVIEQIAYLSRRVTLVPGDILLTGTPAGVGAGSSPPRYLQNDDLVEVEIEDLGRLQNTVTICGNLAGTVS
jgi:2-keto-4-pentenoate hydratase/2-oxohepta-3-ene-1,7-dioic acid hydratase in catechol pathway